MLKFLNYGILSVGFIFLLLSVLMMYYNSKFFYGSVKKNKNIFVWVSSFECGFLSHPMKISSFSMSIFMLLVFFVIFDLEISLLLNSVFQFEFFGKLMFYYLFLILIGFSFLMEVLSGFVSWVY